MAPIDRFRTKYEVRKDGCWIWTGAKSESGYGLLSFGTPPNRRWRSAHRVSYELFKGPFNQELKVCHRCDTPSCVNPVHLFIGTQRDNIEDMMRKGRCIRARGEAVAQSVLTEEQVRHIILRTESIKSASDRLGVATSTIKRIRSGKTWKHLQAGG